jgi:hypothetical protein
MWGMSRRFIGPTLVVVALLLAGVLTVVVSGEESDLAGALMILLLMVAGAGVGLSVSWSDGERH